MSRPHLSLLWLPAPKATMRMHKTSRIKLNPIVHLPVGSSRTWIVGLQSDQLVLAKDRAVGASGCDSGCERVHEEKQLAAEDTLDETTGCGKDADQDLDSCWHGCGDCLQSDGRCDLGLDRRLDESHQDKTYIFTTIYISSCE